MIDAYIPAGKILLRNLLAKHNHIGNTNNKDKELAVLI
jgi:hypothetical protein